jgi:hypothetical protein
MATPANAAPSWTPVALWEMNEHTHAWYLHDSSGNGLRGHIGQRSTPTNRAYIHFPITQRDKVYPGQVSVVPDNYALDPGDSDFLVRAKFRWNGRRHDINLVQKGQGSPVGGLFKMKTTVPSLGQPKGHLKCLFRGSLGDSQVESYSHRRVDDGRWHVVGCGRDANGTYMSIDGNVVDRNPKDPGTISNDWPVAIGGNTYCTDTATENNVCNYWLGDIGFVRWFTR